MFKTRLLNVELLFIIKNKKIGIIVLIAIAAVSIPVISAAHIPYDVENFCDNTNIKNHFHKFNFMCDFAVDHEQRLDALEYGITTITIYNNTSVKTLGGTVKGNIVALCDTGDVVTGGGHSVDPINRSYTLLDSKPLPNLTGYNVTIQSFTTVADYTAYAICLDVTP